MVIHPQSSSLPLLFCWLRGGNAAFSSPRGERWLLPSQVFFVLHRFPESVLCQLCVVGLGQAVSERCRPASSWLFRDNALAPPRLVQV